MAAGGFREFVAGETLDEDKINDYLMQGMLVFGGTAARGSAIPSPVEGQFSFLTDSDTVEFYDGSAWVELSSAPPEFNYLVIGGGGGAGRGRNVSQAEYGGGGAAGGYICSVNGENTGGSATAEPPIFPLPGTVFRVTIGAGGAAGASDGTKGTRGSDSCFGSIIGIGGAPGGAANRGHEDPYFGGSSTSGPYETAARLTGALRQGTSGGRGTGVSGNAGGSGGGAGAQGGDATNTVGGAGGVGLSSSITGTAISRGGGGGGGGSTGGTGGTGGGGAGATGFGAAGSGTANTGGGGGGSRYSVAAGAGGSGVVILKYPDTITLTIGGGLTSSTTSAGGFKVTTFTAGTDTVTIP